jgi:assimilatory nitrate reductase electron transfer subunit
VTRRVLVVGNGMAGARLVGQLRALDANLAVTVLGAEPVPPYNRVLLTNVLAGVTDEDDIALTGPDAAVDCRTGVTVTAIDRAARTVATSTGETIGYDVLVLATGGEPFLPPVKGLTHDDGRLADGVAAFRTLDDCRRIQRLVGTADRVLVLGGGPLGLETACGLTARGVPAEVLQSGERLLGRDLDAEASRLLQRTLADAGVSVRLGASVTEVASDGWLTGVRLADGTHVPGDALLVTCGTRAHTALAAAAGLPVGRGILVDDRMRTADPAIYAAGDCAEHAGTVHGLVAPAWDQAQVAAHVITGTDPRSRYHGSRTITRLKAVGVDLAAMGETHPDQDDDHDEPEIVRFVDSARRTYHKLVIRDGRVAGAILLGRIGMVGTVTQLFDRQAEAPADRRALLFPDLGSGERTGATEMPGTATVCQCNAVTKEAIVHCVRNGATGVAEVAARTRATTGCGGCRALVRELIGSCEPTR